MKKILLFFLLITSLGFAQALYFPGGKILGPTAAPMQRGSGGGAVAPTLPYTPVLYTKWADYQYNSGSTAYWPNSIGNVTPPSAEGYGIQQTIEINKPTATASAVRSVGVQGFTLSFAGTKLASTTQSMALFFRAVKLGGTGFTHVLLSDMLMASDNGNTRLAIRTNNTTYYVDGPSGEQTYWSNGDHVFGMNIFVSTTSVASATVYRDGVVWNTTATNGCNKNPISFCGLANGVSAGFDWKYWIMFDRSLTESECAQVYQYLMSLP